jgi:hypothetical protein
MSQDLTTTPRAYVPKPRPRRYRRHVGTDLCAFGAYPIGAGLGVLTVGTDVCAFGAYPPALYKPTGRRGRTATEPLSLPQRHRHPWSLPQRHRHPWHVGTGLWVCAVGTDLCAFGAYPVRADLRVCPPAPPRQFALHWPTETAQLSLRSRHQCSVPPARAMQALEHAVSTVAWVWEMGCR